MKKVLAHCIIYKPDSIFSFETQVNEFDSVDEARQTFLKMSESIDNINPVIGGLVIVDKQGKMKRIPANILKDCIVELKIREVNVSNKYDD